MTTEATKKQMQRERRRRRVRSTIRGTAERPRLAVFRSNKYLYAQLIDDLKGETIAHVDSRSVSGKTGRDRAHAVGKALATQATQKKVTVAVFDRGGFTYTGSIKAVAEGAREGGLVF